MSPAVNDPDPLDHLTPEWRAELAANVVPRSPLGVRPAPPQIGAVDARWPTVEQPDPVADLVAAYRLLEADREYRPPTRYITGVQHLEASGVLDGDTLQHEASGEYIRGHVRRAVEEQRRRLQGKAQTLRPRQVLCVHESTLSSEDVSDGAVMFTVRTRYHVLPEGFPCPAPDSGMTQHRRPGAS